MMQQERRTSSRKTPPWPTYINLESHNPGIVRDVSEGGLRFRVIDPLKPSWQIHFWFVANSKRIRGTGDLVWMDETRKTGGLRFTHLSGETRDQIRSWLSASNLQLGASYDSTPDFAAQDAPSAAGNCEHCGVPEPAYGTGHRLGQPRSAVSPSRAKRSWPPAPPTDVLEAFPLPSLGTYLQATSRPPYKAILAAVLVMIIAASSYTYRREAGQWLVRLGVRTSEPGKAQSATLASENLAPQHMTKTSRERAEMNVERSLSPQTPVIEAPLRERLAPAEAFVVQVAAVQREADTRVLMESLRDKELPVFVRHSTLDGFYRVLVGPYPDEEAAQITQRELERAGYESFIRH